MAQGVFGYFDFQVTSTGLVGRYMNAGTNGLLPEVARRTSGQAAFDGDYVTTWWEQDGEVTAFLSITHGSGTLVFLEWREAPEGNLIYRGEGFIEAGTLKGYYEMRPF